MGLNRDDGLRVLNKVNSQKTDKIRLKKSLKKMASVLTS